MELAYVPSFLLFFALPLLVLAAIWLYRSSSKREDESFATELPDDLKATFLDAAAFSREGLKSLSNEERLELYAYYKQARFGECSSMRPGMADLVGGAKWEAWHRLSGMSAEEAAQKYIDLVGGHYPEFYDDEGEEFDEGEGDEWEGEEYEEGEEGEEGEEAGEPREGFKVGAPSDWVADGGIHSYVAQKRLSAVRRLLSARPSEVNARDEDGLTPLHWACDRRAPSLVALLLASGADVDALDGEGNPPLSYCLEPEARPVLEKLLAAGADPSLVSGEDVAGADAEIRARLAAAPPA